MTDLLVLCTGNAARSVMAGFMLDALRNGRSGDPLHVVTAGTHTIDGQPMGLRTRTALSRLPELEGSDFRRHRSRQVEGVDLVHAQLVVVIVWLLALNMPAVHTTGGITNRGPS